MTTYLEQVTSQSAYEEYIGNADHAPLPLDDLFKDSGRDWTPGHIAACRLVCKQLKSQVLTEAAQDVTQDEDKDETEENLKKYGCLKEFIDGPPPGYENVNRYRLTKQYPFLGSHWNFLAKFVPAQGSRTGMGLRSTAHTEGTGPSQNTSSRDNDDDIHHPRTLTNSLLDTCVDHIVMMLTSKNPELSPCNGIIEFRGSRYTSQSTLSATDDGGLEYRAKLPVAADGYERESSYPYHQQIAILEAKKAHEAFDDQGPFISDAALAQMLRVALAARFQRHHDDPRTDRSEASDRIHIIFGARTRICFVRFTISLRCLRELENRQLLEFMKMEATSFMDLRNKDDRKSVIQNMRAVLKDCSSWLDDLVIAEAGGMDSGNEDPGNS